MNKKLNREINNWCDEIIKRKIKQTQYVSNLSKNAIHTILNNGLNKSTKVKILSLWDYPAVAVVGYIQQDKIKKAYSKDNLDFEKCFINEMQDARNKKVLCNNVWGHCAEQNLAVKFIMKKHIIQSNPQNVIKKLHFSVALRPRTKLPIDYCENCKFLFPNL